MSNVTMDTGSNLVDTVSDKTITFTETGEKTLGVAEVSASLVSGTTSTYQGSVTSGKGQYKIQYEYVNSGTGTVEQQNPGGSDTEDLETFTVDTVPLA